MDLRAPCSSSQIVLRGVEIRRWRSRPFRVAISVGLSSWASPAQMGKGAPRPPDFASLAMKGQEATYTGI